MSESKIEWHPYPKEKPKKSEDCLVSVKEGDEIFTFASHWIDAVGIFRPIWDGHIYAWAEMPEPYKEEN